MPPYWLIYALLACSGFDVWVDFSPLLWCSLVGVGPAFDRCAAAAQLSSALGSATAAGPELAVSYDRCPLPSMQEQLIVNTICFVATCFWEWLLSLGRFVGAI